MELFIKADHPNQRHDKKTGRYTKRTDTQIAIDASTAKLERQDYEYNAADIPSDGDLQNLNVTKVLDRGYVYAKNDFLYRAHLRGVGDELARLQNDFPEIGRRLNVHPIPQLELESSDTVTYVYGGELHKASGVYFPSGRPDSKDFIPRVAVACGNAWNRQIGLGAGQYLVSGGVEDTLRHEIAHHLYHTQDDLFDHWRDFCKKFPEDVKDISQYAASDLKDESGKDTLGRCSEAFSESFSAWTSKAVQNGDIKYPPHLKQWMEENIGYGHGVKFEKKKSIFIEMEKADKPNQKHDARTGRYISTSSSTDSTTETHQPIHFVEHETPTVPDVDKYQWSEVTDLKNTTTMRGLHLGRVQPETVYKPFTAAGFLKAYNNVGRHVSDLFNRYPEVAKMFERTPLTEIHLYNSTSFKDGRSHLYGQWERRTFANKPSSYILRIAASGKFEKPLKNVSTQEPFRGGYNCGGGFAGVVRHELGHHVINNSTRIETEWKKFYNTNKKLCERVSQYGATNYEESFTENFSVYTSKDREEGKVTMPFAVKAFMDKHIGGKV